MNDISILIVEDEAIIAEDLASKIRKMGYNVAGITATGEEAIQLACQKLPSLVLMDIRLAGAMDGIVAARQIHRDSNLPTLFLSSNSDMATVKRTKLNGTFGYILKPY
ncbi:MAG: response regulator, partial [Desulforhopalus sp.]